MTGLRLKAILSAVSVTVLLLCTFIPVGNNAIGNAIDSETVPARVTAAKNNTPAEAEAAEHAVLKAANVKKIEEFTQEQLETKFIGMLNLNRCFNSALSDEQKLVKSAAVSLVDYAQDKIGYGLCVSTYLIEGFIESFYGVSIPAEQMHDEEAPEGYISLMGAEAETLFNNLVSITATEDGYEVLTCLYSYSGGEEYETCLVKAKFIANPDSQFGFNLVSCEAL